MRQISVIEGTMVPLDRADVDTDQIMPKQFLKRIERTGFGEFVFHDWRQEPDFVLNHPDYHQGNVLVAGPNFGCGSSREHAPWGLQQWGFEAIVAPSFADIFRSNCAKIGLLTVTLPAETCRALMALADAEPMTLCRIDLPAQQLIAGEIVAEFPIDPHTKQVLLEGLDDIGLTMRYEGDVAAFESHRPGYLPVTTARS